MGIIKSGRICSITYPNGNTASVTLGEYQGQYAYSSYHDYNYIKAVERYNAVENRQMLEFDIPSRPASGYRDYEWTLAFSGKYNGVNIPPIKAIVRMYADGEIHFQIPRVIVNNVRIVEGNNMSGWFGYPSLPVPTKWYLCIGRGRDGLYWLYAGLNQAAFNEAYNQITPATKADLYFKASVPMDYNPTFGSMSHPDKYESKPNDASEATMEDTSVNITIDTLPSAVFAGGLFRVYELNNIQMTALSNELADPEIISSIVRAVQSPLDYVVSLKAMPVTFLGFNTELRLGNYTSVQVGNVKQLSNFIFDIDCGVVSIPTYFDSFLDWSPYTNAVLYAPYIGYVTLNLDKFIGQSVHIKYRVDAVSGDCICFVSNDSGLIACYSGNCAYNLPLRANDSSAIVAGLYSAISGLTTGNAGQFASGAFQLTEGVYKPNMVSTSGLTANAGSMCNRKPYLIIERPHVSIPKSYPHNIGYMCRITEKLSNLHGYTEVEAIHLDNVIATREEKAELETLLRSGVVLP